jgi:hypothetical protein
METEDSLPHSQVPATCPQHEPDRSSPHAPTSHFLKIHLNIILPSAHESSKWYISLRFPHQNPTYTSPLSHTCHMPRPSHSSRFDYPKNIWLGVQIITLLIVLPLLLLLLLLLIIIIIIIKNVNYLIGPYHQQDFVGLQVCITTVSSCSSCM